MQFENFYFRFASFEISRCCLSKVYNLTSIYIFLFFRANLEISKYFIIVIELKISELDYFEPQYNNQKTNLLNEKVRLKDELGQLKKG